MYSWRTYGILYINIGMAKRTNTNRLVESDEQYEYVPFTWVILIIPILLFNSQ